VIDVHLNGSFYVSRAAAPHFKSQQSGCYVHMTSTSGLVGNLGQANYAAAKLGIVALSRVAAVEGAKYGVRSNAISPSARTRIETSLKPPPPGVFDVFDPANVSPLVVWLASPDCPATGQVFQAYGNRVEVLAPTAIAADLRTEGRWTVEALDRALAGRLPAAPRLADFVEGL
jgi:NAD(P)-dependent dehydrogenase (short-subunit alcohol dehydrogenase family)